MIMSRVGLVATFRFAPFGKPPSPSPSPSDGEGQGQGQGQGAQEATDADPEPDAFERCWSTLESFLLFHLSKGVQHIFLYADDDRGSNDVYIEKVAETFDKSQVSVDVRNESQRERQQATCRLWSQLGSFSAAEVPARQSLNAEDAMRRAGEMRLDWLLHLDIDELFFTSEPCIQPHFDHLNKLGVEQMTYANHEAVPLREDVGDYFREVSTFKVNHLLLRLTHEVAERSRFWRRRSRHGQYMLAYDNGKSAVRVFPGRVVPQSVHRWRTVKAAESLDPPRQASGGNLTVTDVVLSSVRDQGQEQGQEEACTTRTSAGQQRVSAACGGIAGNNSETLGGGLELTSPVPKEGEGDSDHDHDQLVNRVAMADPRELRFDEVLECSDPCVLHYPSCGLSWLRDKYHLLGKFPSSWFDGKLPIAPCFHLDARDAVHGGKRGGKEPVLPDNGDCVSACDGVGFGEGGDDGRALYRNEVMLCPDEHSEEMQAQLEHGVLRVIDGPARVIQQALDARASSGSRITPELLSTAAEGARLGNQAGGSSASDHVLGTQVVGRNPTDSSSVTVSAALQLAGAMLPGTAGTSTAAAVKGRGGDKVGDGDARPAKDSGGRVDNAWILAACAREFL
eukprot:g9782.t1